MAAIRETLFLIFRLLEHGTAHAGVALACG